MRRWGNADHAATIYCLLYRLPAELEPMFALQITLSYEMEPDSLAIVQKGLSKVR